MCHWLKVCKNVDVIPFRERSNKANMVNKAIRVTAITHILDIWIQINDSKYKSFSKFSV